MFLRITPTKGVGRIIRLRNLSSKLVGTYQILRKIGSMTYEIALLPQLANLHIINVLVKEVYA